MRVVDAEGLGARHGGAEGDAHVYGVHLAGNAWRALAAGGETAVAAVEPLGFFARAHERHAEAFAHTVGVAQEDANPRSSPTASMVQASASKSSPSTTAHSTTSTPLPLGAVRAATIIFWAMSSACAFRMSLSS